MVGGNNHHTRTCIVSEGKVQVVLSSLLLLLTGLAYLQTPDRPRPLTRGQTQKSEVQKVSFVAQATGVAYSALKGRRALVVLPDCDSCSLKQITSADLKQLDKALGVIVLVERPSHGLESLLQGAPKAPVIHAEQMTGLPLGLFVRAPIILQAEVKKGKTLIEVKAIEH